MATDIHADQQSIPVNITDNANTSPALDEKLPGFGWEKLRKFLNFWVVLFRRERRSEENPSETATSYWHRLVAFFYHEVPEREGTEEAQETSSFSWVHMLGNLLTPLRWASETPEVPSPVQGLTYEERKMAFEEKNYWEVLELEEWSSPESIKKKSKDLVIQWHPDKYFKDGEQAVDEATEQCQWIAVAREKLLTGEMGFDFEWDRLKQTVQDLKQKVAEQKKRMAEQDQQLVEQDQQLVEQDQKLVEQGQNLANAERKVQALERELAEELRQQQVKKDENKGANEEKAKPSTGSSYYSSHP